jgi:4-hydroxy-3-methylbut-2-en-1-yl diphosphate reductase
MNIEIDPQAGFCFGVTQVVSKAEEIIRKYGTLYCLGEIVHNQKEIERLESLGLKTISYDEYLKLTDCRVLIRAHGEPPETYRYAEKNNIELIDGSCPIVLKLQGRIKRDFNENNKHGVQFVIFGKKDHAEVRGLAGQTNYQTIIVESPDDLKKIDFTRPIHLYAQTTMSADKYQQLQDEIAERIAETGSAIHKIRCTNSICRQVAGRIPMLKNFCTRHSIILFVSYKRSSNGKLLFTQCKSVNERSYFVTDRTDLLPEWFENASSIGITGATSTPRWLLEQFAEYIRDLKND